MKIIRKNETRNNQIKIQRFFFPFFISSKNSLYLIPFIKVNSQACARSVENTFVVTSCKVCNYNLYTCVCVCIKRKKNSADWWYHRTTYINARWISKWNTKPKWNADTCWNEINNNKRKKIRIHRALRDYYKGLYRRTPLCKFFRAKN